MRGHHDPDEWRKIVAQVSFVVVVLLALIMVASIA